MGSSRARGSKPEWWDPVRETVINLRDVETAKLAELFLLVPFST